MVHPGASVQGPVHPGVWPLPLPWSVIPCLHHRLPGLLLHLSPPPLWLHRGPPSLWLHYFLHSHRFHLGLANATSALPWSSRPATLPTAPPWSSPPSQSTGFAMVIGPAISTMDLHTTVVSSFGFPVPPWSFLLPPSPWSSPLLAWPGSSPPQSPPWWSTATSKPHPLPTQHQLGLLFRVSLQHQMVPTGGGEREWG